MTISAQMAIVVHFDQVRDELPLSVVRGVVGPRLRVVDLLAERAYVTLLAPRRFIRDQGD